MNCMGVWENRSVSVTLPDTQGGTQGFSDGDVQMRLNC